MSVLLGPHVEELEQHTAVSGVSKMTLPWSMRQHHITYLRWRKRQDFDRSALGSHGVAIGRQGDASPASVVQYGGRSDPSRGDRDKFPLAAFAQLLQGTALQTELVALWARTFLWQVKGC